MDRVAKSRAHQILEDTGAKATPVGDLPGWLNASAALGQAWIVDGLTPFRKWLGLAPDTGGRRPSAEFFRVLLGHGEDGARALLDQYIAEKLGGDPLGTPAGKRTIEAVLHAVRLARAAGVVAFDLNQWKPASDQATRFLIALQPDLHERLKAAAESSDISMNALAVAGIEEMVLRNEQGRRPRA